MWRMAYLAAAAVIWWGSAVPVEALAKEGNAQPEVSGSAGEKGEDSGNNVEITIDPDVDEEFLVIEIMLQIVVQAAESEGEPLDLEQLEKDLLEVAETDRQKAYAHLRVAELYYQRGDREAAIESLKKGLPLADGDRSKGSLYYRILVSLLTVYNETGQIREAAPYLKIYREIVSAGVDPWEHLPDTEDVVHKPTGVRLPQKLNMFTRERLIVFDDTGRDAGATYKVNNAEFPELTVYVVAKFEEDAQTHFNKAMGLILNRFKGAKVLSRGPYSVETDKGKIEGFAGYVNVPATQGFRLGLGSDLYVFVRKGTLVKFRISFRQQNRKTIEGVMRDIFKGFDWP